MTQTRPRPSLPFALVLALLVLLPPSSFGRSSDEAVAESAKPRAVAGAAKFSVALPSDKAFAAVVAALQKLDYDIEVANKDGGMIASSIAIEGSWHQTGTRAVATIIHDTDTTTIVRIVVTEQRRYKALQVEPWSDPKANAASTAKLAGLLKAEIGVK